MGYLETAVAILEEFEGKETPKKEERGRVRTNTN
jgi:hypothetical protein